MTTRQPRATLRTRHFVLLLPVPDPSDLLLLLAGRVAAYLRDMWERMVRQEITGVRALGARRTTPSPYAGC